MIKRLIFILLAALSFALAVDYETELNNFDKNLAHYSVIEKDKAYNAMQHIYISSIMKGNDTLKYEVLKRIIQVSKELNYDSLVYEKELNTLSRSNNRPIEIFTPITTPKSSAQKPQEPETLVFAGNVLKVEESENLTSKEVTTQITQKSENEPMITAATTEKPKETAILSAMNQSGNSIIFSFDRELNENEIKAFTLKAQNGEVRYVYDIRAVKGNTANTNNVKTQLKDVRLSQFDKNTTRIVFESQKEIDIVRKITAGQLIFTAKEFNLLSQQTNATPTVKPLLKKRIVIDAGHGGRDSGAVYNSKYLEKDVVLQIALILGKELESRGHTVVYTRQSDNFLKLRERTKIANDKNADLFISLHVNAAPKSTKNDNTKWQGIETFFLSPSDSQRSKNAAELENQSDVDEMDFYSKNTFLNFLNREKIIASHKLALDIQQYLLGAVRKTYDKVIDGGVREAPFWVLTGAQMPAVLLEVGYITDKTDRERMFDKKFQQLLASGISDGITSYFAKNE
ncbi:MAG: N-acetylmuramoyl-L-alanine amidase [Campylobacteraceae bacterium]|jgi:N-acetylmuramoyl-L-alanine amidase|nr:N-acetylmuramoyl-L-alanine amidase [Campylobacteraceae bacterium]